MASPDIKTLDHEFSLLEFIGDRSPDSTDQDIAGAFAELAGYRDGGIFIGHYAGNSQWERHARGDEIVYVVDGETTLFLLDGESESACRMRAGQMLVVARNTWHRFESPAGVKILTVTPQPTDHSRDRPAG